MKTTLGLHPLFWTLNLLYWAEWHRLPLEPDGQGTTDNSDASVKVLFIAMVLLLPKDHLRIMCSSTAPFPPT